MAQDLDASSPYKSCARPTGPVLGVVVDRSGDQATVAVSGRLTPEKAAEACWIVWGLVETGTKEIEVDLADSWDVADLLGELARARGELAERGGVLRLSGVAVPELLAALIAAPLEEVFLVYDSVRHQTSHRPAVGRRTDWSIPAPGEERSA